MHLPSLIITTILTYLGMPDLSWKTARKHKRELMQLRTEMHMLSDDFSRVKANEDAYPNAYFAYNFPINYMKTRYVMDTVSRLYRSRMDKRYLKVLDIGCGEGAGLFGVYHAHPDLDKIVLHGFDTSRSMINKCRYVARSLYDTDRRLRVRIHQRDISDGLLKTQKKYDIIILSNSLIELTMDAVKAHRFLLRISKNLEPEGMIIIIEPALVTASQRLMELRELMVEKRKLQVLLPCLHESACPLVDLRGGKEWCHQSIRWRPPEYLQVINQGLNRDINMLKFSYLIVSRNAPAKPDGLLAVSSLMKEKGRKRCFLCTPDGRVEIARLNKHKSLINKNFDLICKGTVIALDTVEKRRSDYWIVTKDSRVELLFGYDLS